MHCRKSRKPNEFPFCTVYYLLNTKSVSPSRKHDNEICTFGPISLSSSPVRETSSSIFEPTSPRPPIYFGPKRCMIDAALEPQAGFSFFPFRKCCTKLFLTDTRYDTSNGSLRVKRCSTCPGSWGLQTFPRKLHPPWLKCDTCRGLTHHISIRSKNSICHSLRIQKWRF